MICQLFIQIPSMHNTARGEDDRSATSYIKAAALLRYYHLTSPRQLVIVSFSVYLVRMGGWMVCGVDG